MNTEVNLESNSILVDTFKGMISSSLSKFNIGYTDILIGMNLGKLYVNDKGAKLVIRVTTSGSSDNFNKDLYKGYADREVKRFCKLLELEFPGADTSYEMLEVDDTSDNIFNEINIDYVVMMLRK